MPGRVTHELNVEALRVRGGEIQKVPGCVTGVINFNVASPFTVLLGTIPKGAIIIETLVNVITAFNAGTTNVLEVGTAGSAAQLVAAADVNEASATPQRVSKDIAELTADTKYFAKYTQTGTAATTGKARVTINYVI